MCSRVNAFYYFYCRQRRKKSDNKLNNKQFRNVVSFPREKGTSRLATRCFFSDYSCTHHVNGETEIYLSRVIVDPALIHAGGLVCCAHLAPFGAKTEPCLHYTAFVRTQNAYIFHKYILKSGKLTKSQNWKLLGSIPTKLSHF